MLLRKGQEIVDLIFPLPVNLHVGEKTSTSPINLIDGESTESPFDLILEIELGSTSQGGFPHDSEKGSPTKQGVGRSW